MTELSDNEIKKLFNQTIETWLPNIAPEMLCNIVSINQMLSDLQKSQIITVLQTCNRSDHSSFYLK